MAPLLYAHLQAVDAPVPEPVHLALKGLYLRHQRATSIYDQVLCEILQAFAGAGIEALVLKGAALAHLVYPQPGLRPRRDLDILVRQEEAVHAYQLLGAAGFQIAPTLLHGLSRYHQHCAEATRKVDQLSISVELHLNLFFRFKPYGLPSGTYDDLVARAMSFDLDGITAYTLGREEMLWHLYHHGFSVPLRLAMGRLLGAADIVSLVEKWLAVIDWERVRRCYPQLFNALPMFHFLTPWSEAVLDRLQLPVARVPGGVGEVYEGYPRQWFREHVRRGLRRSLRETFWPSEWWVRMYYGLPATTPVGVGRARHAAHILWDLAIYATSLLGPFKVHPFDE